MSFLYISEHGCSVGIEAGYFVVRYPDGHEDKIPKEPISGISLMGQSQLTSACSKYCLEKGIRVSYFSSQGKYYGALVSTEHTNVKRLKQQVKLSEDATFCIGLAQSIIEAKIGNQLVLARRYLRNSSFNKDELLFPIKNCKNKISQASSIEEIMGYEGYAAKSYFSVLGKVVDEEFAFQGRSKRPPKDPFNAMLSLGYSILLSEMHGELENRGMSPYIGFLHQDKSGHAALASDMIEEWRAVLVDTTVMSKLEMKMYTETHYLVEFETTMNFRQALWHQAESLARAIELNDYAVYQPVKIR